MADTKTFLKSLIDNFFSTRENDIAHSTIYFKECLSYIHHQINLTKDPLSHFVWINDPYNDYWVFQEITKKVNEFMDRKYIKNDF